MPDLVFGEAEAVYDYNPKKTASEVADALENRFHLLSSFAEYKEEEIAEILAEGMERVIAELFETGENPGLAHVADGVQPLFSDFIKLYEAESVIEGTPTKRALAGYKSLQRPHKGPRRPSFFDTGTLVDNFRAWVEE